MTTLLHLLVYLAVTSLGPAQLLQYKCFPNNTIIVTNPSPETFTSIVAGNSFVQCATAWQDENRKLVEITGCTKDKIIWVSFMNRPLAAGLIIGGNKSEHFSINCAEIPLDGVDRTVINGFTAYVSANKVVNVTPSFRIHTQICDNSTRTVNVNSTSVGTLLYWAIEGPREYHLMPLTCKAFSGFTVIENISKIITVNGCSEDDELVGDFIVDGPGELGASLFAFRFYNSPHVTFQCVVRVCPASSVFCNFNCSNRKKRESLPVPDDPRIQQQLVTTHLTFVPAEDEDIESSVDVSSAISMVQISYTLMIAAVQLL